MSAAEDISAHEVNAEADEDWDILETVCCICDDGGDVICCDGECFRSFHLSKGDSECPSLGLSKAQAERMDKFLCPNCQFKMHQCFVCRQLGRSDAAAPEVFRCKVPMCGLFYHPSCAAKLILYKVKDPSDDGYTALVESIKQGNWFECPRHTCRKCGGGENKNNVKKQFGICRRCPRAWHRQCLPHSVLCPKPGEPQRAWDDLLPSRILIYCERHPIIPKLGTPARNHVKFPEAALPLLQRRLVKRKVEEEQQKRKLSRVNIVMKRDNASVRGPVGENTAELLKGNTEEMIRPFLSIAQTKAEDHGLMKNKQDRAILGHQALSTKVSVQAPAVFSVKGKNNVASSARQQCSSKDNGQKVSKPHKISLLSKCVPVSDAKLERTGLVVSKSGVSGSQQLQQKTKPLESKLIKVDSEARLMVKGIIERAKSSITIEHVRGKHVVPAGYERNPMNLDKVFTLVKIESIVTGMRKALETLENGGSIEDAKVKCSPEFVKFVELCNRRLRAFLGPFLHGRRYTSFGRHFTNPGKLIEIVERLHWYVDEGDMVVDFCCGSNDFSLLMKQKMEETGKECEYKNFDLIQTNKEFNFHRGNWFDVKEDQFPDGNRLIIGLNPPFALANRFINHALKFKPKLIILIVPRETERLDQKRDMYDLIWEDGDLLAGKSFYLPGSLDEDDNTLDDWNMVTSPLYVWSKPNWTLKHKQIALERGHISLISSSRYVGDPCSKTSLRIPSSSDCELEKGNNYAAPMVHGGGEGSASDKNKHDMSMEEPVVMHEPKDRQDTGLGKGNTNAFEQEKSNIEVLECNMVGVDSVIVSEPNDKQETVIMQGSFESVKLKDADKRSRDLLVSRNVELSDMACCGKSNTHGKVPCVQDQVSLHMRTPGGAGDSGFTTQNGSAGFDNSLAARGVRGSGVTSYAGDGYAMPYQTEGILRASGQSAISQMSFRRPHQNRGRGWQGNMRTHVRPVYGSFQPLQRPPLGLHNPTPFCGHNPSSSRPACIQTSLSHYPPVQERPSSQGNVYAAGGWLED